MIRPSVLVVAALLAACQSGAPTAESLPEIPEPRLDSLFDGVRGRLQQAWESARQHPMDAAANGRLGMLLHAYEQYQSAVACYSRAAALDPQDARWPYYRGVVQGQIGQHEDAVRSFGQALEHDPEYTAARVRLAETLLALDRLPESRESFQKATKLDPSSATAHYGLGRVATAQGNVTEAIESYVRACELAPEAGAAHYALALAYRDRGEEDKARSHLAVYEGGNRELPPLADPLMAEVANLRTDHHYHLNEGVRLEARGDLQGAKAEYEKAIEIDGEYAQPHVNLIAVYGQLGRFEEAELHYKRALELNPDLEELHINWGTLEAARKRPTEAAKSFRKALELNPNSADVHADLGLMLYELGKREEAVQHFRDAIRNEPNHRLAHFHLGRDLVSGGRVEDGLEHLLKTREPVDERTPGFLYGLADAYVRAGRLDQALSYGHQAKTLAENMGQQELAAAIERDLQALQSAR